MKNKVKIGNHFFNGDHIVSISAVSKDDGSKHWVKVTLVSKSKNEKGFDQNDFIFVEFANRTEAQIACETA